MKNNITKTNKISTNKTLNILVVEDGERHLLDAKSYFCPIENDGVIKVDYVSTLRSAEDAINKKKYRGIITDVFFPMGVTDEMKRKRDLLKIMDPTGEFNDIYETQVAITGWYFNKDLPPSGVFIAKYARENNMPAVLCSSTHHHGHASEPVFVWSRSYDPRIPFVDLDRSDELSSSPKNWRKAYGSIILQHGNISDCLSDLLYSNVEENLARLKQHVKKCEQEVKVSKTAKAIAGAKESLVYAKGDMNEFQRGIDFFAQYLV